MEYFFFLTDTRHIWTCIKVSEWYWHIAASAREVWHLTQQHLASSVTPGSTLLFFHHCRPNLRTFSGALSWRWLITSGCFPFFCTRPVVCHTHSMWSKHHTTTPSAASLKEEQLFMYLFCFLNAKWHGGRMTQHVLPWTCSKSRNPLKISCYPECDFYMTCVSAPFYVVVVFTDREKVEALFTNSEKTLDLEPCTG